MQRINNRRKGSGRGTVLLIHKAGFTVSDSGEAVVADPARTARLFIEAVLLFDLQKRRNGNSNGGEVERVGD